jgi:glycosyltransferase involved in cell wall biosynthesis
VKTPRFSIVTVCLNAGSALRETALGVLEQEADGFEYLVHDGGSSDGSLDGLPDDPRIRVRVESDDGIYDAMNRAARAATGEYLCFLNAGDRFPGPDTLAKVAAALETCSPPVDLLYGDAFDERSGKRRRAAPILSRKSLFLDGVCHQSQWIRREAFLELGGLDPAFRFRADQELLLRLVEAHRPTRYLPEVLSLYDGRGFSARKENRAALDAEWAELRRGRYTRSERLLWGLRAAAGGLWWKRLLLDLAMRWCPGLLERRRARRAD